MSEAQVKYGIKSAEQRMIEKATAEYASKLKAILGDKASARISIDGVPLSKIATIAEFMRDDEGEKMEITKHNKHNVLYLHDNQIKADGYEVEYIGE